MLSKLKELLDKNKSAVIGGGLALAFIGFFASHLPIGNNTSPAKSSVMITNRAGNSGGTGIVINSSKNESQILTNKHVCGVVKNGGMVRNPKGDYQVVSYLESDRSDLCLLTVADDLEASTKVAEKAPRLYAHAQISGHPALMPNVITEGHVSGRKIIEVFSGIRNCTPEEETGELGMFCAIFGGMPIIEAFESTLVTATIMPGSSGSGIYNSSNELIGVVFAGSGNLGYAWTVPYEQVINFLYKDHQNLKSVLLSQELNLKELIANNKKRDWRSKIKEANERCETEGAENETLAKACEILKNDDMIWRK